VADYPLLFRIAHVVRCEKFEALIVTEGRALMALEEGDWWCHGVEPGGLTENGEGPLVAFERFRLSLRHVLEDLSEESGSLEEFQRDARMFFSTDAVEEARWNEALRGLRSAAQIEEPFRDMERVPPRPSVMTIEMLASFANAPMRKATEVESVALPLAA
jgi:hypothetical protein